MSSYWLGFLNGVAMSLSLTALAITIIGHL